MQGKKDNASSSEASGFPELSDGDTKLLIGVMLHSPRPSPDWAAVAKTIGSASGGSASKRFSNLVAKLGLYQNGNTPTASQGTMKATATPKATRTKTTATSSGRKRSAKMADTADKEEEETPTKKAKTSVKEEVQELNLYPTYKA